MIKNQEIDLEDFNKLGYFSRMNWITYYTPEGIPYYFNVKTGESTWNDPLNDEKQKEFPIKRFVFNTFYQSYILQMENPQYYMEYHLYK